MIRAATPLRMIATAWIVAWLACAGLLAAIVVARGDEPTPSPPSAAQEPAEVAEIAPGLTARTVGVETSAAETTVTIEVAGREELGPSAGYHGLAVITGADGRPYPERRSSARGRLLTLTFPGAAILAPGAAVLRLPAVGVGPAGSDVEALGGARLAVNLPARLEVVHVPLSTDAPLGPGTIQVGRVTRDDETVVVVGTLEGFTREQIQSIDLRQTRLRLADGTERALSGGQHGSGEDLREFELHFSAPAAADIASLVLTLDVAPLPEHIVSAAPAEVRESLDALVSARGATATLRLAP
jgi:hypothetical protein